MYKGIFDNGVEGESFDYFDTLEDAVAWVEGNIADNRIVEDSTPANSAVKSWSGSWTNFDDETFPIQARIELV